MNHSRYSPSAAHRWIPCPGSVAAAEAAPPRPSSPYAEEGVRVAAAAEQAIKAGHFNASYVLDDVHDAEHLQVYLDHVRAITDDGVTAQPERMLDLAALWPDFHGTADCVIVDSFTKRAHVIDLKWGEGVYVVAAGNVQLMIYALGVLLAHPEIETLCLTIVQPRYGDPASPKTRTWAVPAAQLWQWAVTDLVPALRLASRPGAPLKPGEHCRFCPAKATCPALRMLALDKAERDFAAPPDLSNADLATILDKAALLDAWVQAVRDEAHARAQRGEDIPGYVLTPGRTTREWTDPENTPASLREIGLADDVIYETKLRSVAQVEKRLPKAERPTLAAFYDSKPGGLKLVRDDGRTPVKSRVQQDFEPAFLA